MRFSLSQLFTPTGILAVWAFLLPWQTRYIFGWSYLSGQPTEFGTLSVYATQVMVLIGLSVVYFLHGWPKFNRQTLRFKALSGVLLLAAVVSAYFTQNSVAALAGALDLAFAVLIFVALLDERVNLRAIGQVFVWGLCLPVMLGLWQVVTGFNPAVTWLGLAARDAQHLGDAVVLGPGGVRILRAYGSFPHPNIFGGYLVVGILTAVTAFKSAKIRFSLMFWLSLGLFLTMSRAAILGLLVALLIKWLAKKISPVTFKKIALPSVLMIVTSIWLLALALPNLTSQLRGGSELEQRSINERLEQYQAWPQTMSGRDWLIGNGPRNYTYALAENYPQQSVWDYQPIHNLPLLILAELGVLGLGIVILGLGWLYKAVSTPIALAMLASLLTIAAFDHYLWSFWSGLILVALVMAHSLSENKYPVAN
jgi:O-antigen ligase